MLDNHNYHIDEMRDECVDLGDSGFSGNELESIKLCLKTLKLSLRFTITIILQGATDN